MQKVQMTHARGHSLLQYIQNWDWAYRGVLRFLPFSSGYEVAY